jgi:hypothetical protein
MNQLSTASACQEQKSPSFIELKLKGQEPKLPLNYRTPCAIELTRPDGAIMKIFASNDTPLHLLEFCELFLRENQ